MEKVRCPFCKNWATWKENPFRPFCSDRCKNHDLGNWATEKYRVESEDEEMSESAEARKKEDSTKES